MSRSFFIVFGGITLTLLRAMVAFLSDKLVSWLLHYYRSYQGNSEIDASGFIVRPARISTTIAYAADKPTRSIMYPAAIAFEQNQKPRERFKRNRDFFGTL